MPMHDVLESRQPGFRPGLLLFGLLAAVAAYLLALVLLAALSMQAWMAVLVAALGAAAATGLLEKASTTGPWTAMGSSVMVAVGFGLGLGLMILFLPTAWVPTDLLAFARRMPIQVEGEPHVLVQGRQVYAAYLMAGGMMALIACVFACGGMQLVLHLHVVAWAVLLAYPVAFKGNALASTTAMLKSMAAALPFLILALAGLAAVGAGARETTRRLLGKRQGALAAGEPLLLVLVGVLLLLAAATVELFGRGMLENLLGK